MKSKQTQLILSRLKTFEVALLCSILCAVCLATHAQEKLASAQKFDEFWQLRADDEQAHLDRFAAQVTQKQNLEAFIVAYREDDILRGAFLRQMYGYRDYLVNKRAVEPRRLKIVEGGIAEKPMIELWLVPSGSQPPHIPALEAPTLASPRQFDRLTFGPGCESEYSLVLEQPGDALNFFAETLRDDPTLKGFILVRPAERKSLRSAAKLAVNSKHQIVSKYGVAAKRIVSRVEKPRGCAEIDLWLAPLDLAVSQGQSAGQYFRSQLMAEAEQNHYTIRRIEFIGNERTRDETLRQQTLSLKEGDLFKKTLLLQSLASLSSVKSLKSVGLNDVEVHLNSREKEIDVLILIRERRRLR